MLDTLASSGYDFLGVNMIYLDHNAATPPSPKVQVFIKTEMTTEWWANPSSEHALGIKLGEEIAMARSTVAESLNASTKSLVFTSGATESINNVLLLDNLQRLDVKKIVTNRLEHHATLDRVKYLAQRGIEVAWIDNDQAGKLNLSELRSLVDAHTLVTLLAANNEIGTINPIQEITAIVHECQGFMHVDAVQAWGKYPVDLEAWDVDFASFSGHKIGALKGVGVLYAKDIKNFLPLLHGGGQERRYRPGTLNAAGIKSVALAVQDISLETSKRLEVMRDWLETEVIKLNNAIEVNAGGSQRLCNTSNFYLGGRSSREVLMQLSRNDIYVSTGSACTASSYEPSHVITGLGHSKIRGEGSLRVSLGPDTTEAELKVFVQTLVKILSE